MLIPTVILIFLIATNKSRFEQVFSFEVISKLSISNKNLTKSTRNALLFIALILMIISLSRPVMNEKETNLEQKVIPIVLSIDVSKSMLAQDLYPNRFEFSKRKIIELISKENSDLAFSFITFAKSSYILSPLTFDMTSLKFIVNNFSFNNNIADGSNILSLLEASNKLLKNFKEKYILIFSDGGNKEDYTKEIEFAKENNIKIYTIGMATNNPSPIPSQNGFITNENGEIVTVKLNKNIKELALKSGGAYIDFTIDKSDIEIILKDIKSNSSNEFTDNKKYKVYTELFYYPLALALFFIFLAFNSFPKFKKKISILILAIFFYINNSSLEASILDFKTLEDAKKDYKNGNYSKSSDKYKDFINKPEGKYNFANSLYKDGKYESALKAYSDISTSNDDLRFKKLHNMGNSYVKLNDLENAIKMYEKALSIKEDKETKENLEKVKEALNNKNNDDNKDNKKSENKDSNSQNNNSKNQQQKTNEENSKTDEQKNSPENENPNLMSNSEEKKWMDMLEDKNSPILMKKFDSKNQEESSSNKTPW